MLAPSPQIARPVGVVLCLGVVLADAAGIRQLFELEAYLGVGVILAIGVALTAASTLLVHDRDGAWIFALAVGVLNALGVLSTHTPGLPLLKAREVAQGWFQESTLMLGVDALLLAALAGWVLIARHLPDTAPDAPVTSAVERAARPVEPSPVPLPRRHKTSRSA